MGQHIRLTQSGGLAGIEMVAAVDLDDLPAPAATRVRKALDGLDFDRPATGPSAPGPGGPDRFQYDLEVHDGTRRSLTAHEPDVAPELQTVIDVLLPLARPQ
jgi:hypothetical protein